MIIKWCYGHFWLAKWSSLNATSIPSLQLSSVSPLRAELLIGWDISNALRMLLLPDRYSLCRLLHVETGLWYVLRLMHAIFPVCISAAPWCQGDADQPDWLPQWEECKNIPQWALGPLVQCPGQRDWYTQPVFGAEEKWNQAETGWSSCLSTICCSWMYTNTWLT